MNPNQAWAPWPRRAADVSLTERHVFLDVRGIRLMHQRWLAKTIFPLAVFTRKQVALALATAENFAGAGDFEPFGDGLSGFGKAWFFGHKGAKARWKSAGCKGKNAPLLYRRAPQVSAVSRWDLLKYLRMSGGLQRFKPG